MSFTYFAKQVDGDLTKIGQSKSPGQRIMQSSITKYGKVELVAVFRKSVLKEREAHNIFDEFRIGRSEWFRLPENFMQRLRGLVCEPIENFPSEMDARFFVAEDLHAEIKAEAARQGVKIPYLASVILEDGLSRVRSGKLTIHQELAR